MKKNYQNNRIKEGSYLNDLNNEIRVLELFSKYENSVKYYGNYDKDNQKIIVLEKCDGDLKKLME